nr:MAG TPA: hypothetical protein [Caudoviricetes sp.]
MGRPATPHTYARAPTSNADSPSRPRLLPAPLYRN